MISSIRKFAKYIRYYFYKMSNPFLNSYTPLSPIHIFFFPFFLLFMSFWRALTPLSGHHLPSNFLSDCLTETLKSQTKIRVIWRQDYNRSLSYMSALREVFLPLISVQNCWPRNILLFFNGIFSRNVLFFHQRLLTVRMTLFFVFFRFFSFFSELIIP